MQFIIVTYSMKNSEESKWVAVAFRCCCALINIVLNSIKNLSVSGSQIVSPADAILYFRKSLCFCEEPGYVMSSLPVLRNHFRFLIYRTPLFYNEHVCLLIYGTWHSNMQHGSDICTFDILSVKGLHRNIMRLLNIRQKTAWSCERWCSYFGS